VGKSSIFNALTGLHQPTGNWTGKTVGCTVGVCRRKQKAKTPNDKQTTILLADLPGCYSLKPHSAEENEALDFLRTQPIDAVVVVCDALNLERNLLLAYQIQHIFRESPVPLIVCINLIDEARKQGVEINPEKLSEITGFTVVATSAKSGIGLDRLRAEIASAAEDRLPARHAPLCERTDRPCDVPSAAEFLSTTRQAVSVATSVSLFAQTAKRKHHLPLADCICMGRYTAIPVALAFLSIVFWLTIVGANYPSAWLSSMFGRLGEWLAAGAVWSRVPWWMKGFLLDGVYRTLTWVVSVMLPPMAIFFPLYTLLEDIGFLPRIAFNFDRCFRSCHACGKQSLTMCMGFGCNAAGVTACRIIDSPRERMIAVLTNSLVPCNGKFPTILAMVTILLTGTVAGKGMWVQVISAFAVTVCILVSVGITFLVSKILSLTLLKGQPGGFILELPPYRVPHVGQVLVRSMLDRTLYVLGRAIIVAAPAGGILWICGQIEVGDANLLVWLSQQIHPMGIMLGVNGAVLIALVLAAPANELVLPVLWMIYSAGGTLTDYSSIGALSAQLTAHNWTWQTVVCFLILFIFHAPCTTTLLTVKKETGSWRWTGLAAIIPIVVGVLFCVVVKCVFIFI
jgi:ferrous iron transport protein B